MKAYKILFLVTLLIIPFVGSAQHAPIRTVSGTFKYTFPSNISIENAKQEALSRAQNELLEQEFGRNINSVNSLDIRNSDGKSSTEYRSSNMSTLRGKWLGNVGEPVYKFLGFDDKLTQFTLSVSLKGKVREHKSSKINFKATITKNVANVSNESHNFADGDHLYVLFEAPCTGYLSIYLADSENKVYFLNPVEQESQNNIITISHVNECIPFYNPNYHRPMLPVVVENHGNIEEHEEIYIIFSPNRFAPPKYTREVGGRDILHVTSKHDFITWLEKTSIEDEKFDYVVKDIYIAPLNK